MVSYNISCMEFRWASPPAIDWLYFNVKSPWKVVRGEPEPNNDNPHFIVFADGKDAIMFKLLWL